MSTLTNYSELIQFSFLHRRIRRAWAHAVSKEPANNYRHKVETQPASSIGSLPKLCGLCTDPDGGQNVRTPPPPPPPETESQKYRVSQQYWSGSSIQCWAIIGLFSSAKLQLNGVSLAGQRWPALSAIWIVFPLIKKTSEFGKTFWISAWWLI